MIHVVYILFSFKINAFYKGQTNDLVKRFIRHNKGLEAFTRSGIPWVLVWSTAKNSRKEAIDLESKLKNLSKKRLIKFISKFKSGLHLNDQDWDILRGS